MESDDSPKSNIRLHPSLGHPNQRHPPLQIPDGLNSQASSRLSPMHASSPRSARISPRPRAHHHSHHPYRSSSRQSTASSSAEGDGDDDYQYSDYDWHSGERRNSQVYTARRYSMSDDSGGRELERANSFRSVGGHVGLSAGRRLSTNEALPTAPSTTLSSPNTSSPVFSFSNTSSSRTSSSVVNYSRPFYPPPSPATSYMSPATTRPASSQTQNHSGSPLSLDSLPSYPADQKPPFSYPVLIRLAILGSSQKRLLLSQIYSAIEEKFPWYKESAPKAWKASVRHCLSLNKEFVRMQRAVEDPGVGCGGWWSVDEGTKGLKRPRKRRPAQSRRGDDMGGENGPSDYPESVPPDHPLEYSPAPSSQRRYSVSTEGYSRPEHRSPVAMSRPLSSFPSVSPISRVPPEDRDEGMDYSLRLPPIFVPDKPPSVDARVATSVSIVPDPLPPSSRHQWRAPHGHQREHSHTPTASTSSSFSTNSHSGFSDRSEESGSLSSSGHVGSALGGGRRSNPMNISSLLNGQLRIPKEEGDPLAEVEMKHEGQKEEDGDVSMMLDGMTPFSSEQTIRPASSRRDSPPPTIFAMASTDRRPYSSGSSYAREDASSLHANTSYVRSSTPDARSVTTRDQGRSPLHSSSSKLKKTGPKEKIILTQNLSKVWGSSADLTRLDVEPESE